MTFNVKDIEELYISLFDRAPEGDATNYWVDNANKLNFSKPDILNALLEANLHNNMGGGIDLFSLNNDEFIDEIYLRLLDKSNDTQGKSYWVDALNSNFSKSDILFAIIDNLNSNNANKIDKDNFDAKVLLSNYFSLNTKGLGSFNKEINDNALLKELSDIISNTNSKNLIASKSNMDILIDTLKHFNDVKPPIIPPNIKPDDTLVLNNIEGTNTPTTTNNIKNIEANINLILLLILL